MAITAHSGEQIRTIRLSGSVDIASAAELKRDLMDALEGDSAIRIDLGGLEDIDVTVIQLLLAAQHQAAAAGREFRIVGPWNPAIESRLQPAGISPSQIFSTQQAER